MRNLFYLFVIIGMIGCQSGTKKPGQKENLGQHIKDVELTVQGGCDQCKDRIESAVKSIGGVKHAEWNKETKQLYLQFDSTKVSLDSISSVIAAKGHETDIHLADSTEYCNLPNCCHYVKR